MSEQAVGNNGSGSEGIVAKEAQLARAAVADALSRLSVSAPARGIDLRPVPFAGTWGVATSVCHAIAGDQVLAELEASGALEGLSKKEAKQKSGDLTRGRAQELALQVVEQLQTSAAGNGFATVEAANGFINIYFDANQVATHLIREVLSQGPAYGQGAPKHVRLMVEHSQPNTHKAFHIGHLRNSALGIAISNILATAGYDVMQATYPGDIGAHVIKSLWCYENFHQGEEPSDPLQKGRWLASIYAEADSRLAYRKSVLDFLAMLAKEDQAFVSSIDRLLKYLWRKSTHGEDIAYLLGRFTHQEVIKEEMLREDDVIEKFWPIVGEQLSEELNNPRTFVPIEGMAEPTMSPEERLATWAELNQHLDWWTPSIGWQESFKATFKRWEEREPSLVQLWEETREWSLVDLRRIFAELGAHFDVWFFESEVEESGKEVVQELLDKGIAEVSPDGLTIVKIDEKLGLEQETYRTAPILRSDGSSLYATKDLSLTRRKFQEYAIDRAIWVIDVRQSLYFQQVLKILELDGFEQAKVSQHLGYEIVALPEGVMSSRKGNAPLYDDVRDAVMNRASEIITEKNPSMAPETREVVAHQVALGSLKYAMLARDNNKVVIFDLEEALSFDGHAAPYLQYAHARASRILENAGGMPSAPASLLHFGETLAPEELSLLQQIAALPEDVQRAADQFRPILIANYAYELAKRFNDFYHACPVLHSEEPVRSARLTLVAATRTALANSLALLGIAAPEVM